MFSILYIDNNKMNKCFVCDGALKSFKQTK